MSIEDRIIEGIEKISPTNTTVEYNDDAFEFSSNNRHFLKFYIYEGSEINYLYISELKKSQTMSGTQILEMVELICTYVNQFDKKIRQIRLEDDSRLEICEKYFLSIKLSFFRILAKGESWYNSKGYYQENYQEEKSEWVEMQNTKFWVYFNKFQNEENMDIFDSFEGLPPFESVPLNYEILINITYNFIRDEFEKRYSLIIDDLNIGFIFELLYNGIRTKCSENYKILCFLLVSIFSLYIDYDNFLIKNI